MPMALGRTSGFRMFLAVVPFGEQLRADYLARDVSYVTKPQRRLREICLRRGIPYLDLMPLLNHRHLQSDRIHLTSDGKAVVALALANFLRRQQVVPTR